MRLQKNSESMKNRKVNKIITKIQSAMKFWYWNQLPVSQELLDKKFIHEASTDTRLDYKVRKLINKQSNEEENK
jgi:hypothetical protein